VTISYRIQLGKSEKEITNELIEEFMKEFSQFNRSEGHAIYPCLIVSIDDFMYLSTTMLNGYTPILSVVKGHCESMYQNQLKIIFCRADS
jgi:hypothetical protein